jgi:hypothetical protein
MKYPTQRHLPSIVNLNTFEVIARRLSITAAADELGLTQSVMPRQLAQLAFHLRVLTPRLLILRRLRLLVDLEVFRRVVVFDDRATLLAPGVLQALLPQRTAGTVPGLEDIFVAGIALDPFALPGRAKARLLDSYSLRLTPAFRVSQSLRANSKFASPVV